MSILAENIILRKFLFLIIEKKLRIYSKEKESYEKQPLIGKTRFEVNLILEFFFEILLVFTLALFSINFIPIN